MWLLYCVVWFICLVIQALVVFGMVMVQECISGSSVIFHWSSIHSVLLYRCSGRTFALYNEQGEAMSYSSSSTARLVTIVVAKSRAHSVIQNAVMILVQACLIPSCMNVTSVTDSERHTSLHVKTSDKNTTEEVLFSVGRLRQSSWQLLLCWSFWLDHEAGG